MKYVLYLRVSTEQQVLSNLGIEGQRECCLRYISRTAPNSAPHNVLEFVEEGLCGAIELEKRPALLSAISVLEKGDVMLVSQRDRLSRGDPFCTAMIERAIERKKARLISASGDVLDSTDPGAILMKRMVDAFAEYERLIIGSRTRVALQIKKRKGERVGYIPYGYKLNDDKVHISPCEHETKILSLIAEHREMGLPYRKIAKNLNELRYYNRANRPWNHVSLQRVSK